ncbi:Na+/H+ antiporter subunit E [Ilumatobacter sp.]|uniref:Na+/H+ antiporter subunit E n=1 Tax=Ilumatobacter sp. TaxID=1967498 RepID=UPI003B527D4B
MSDRRFETLRAWALSLVALVAVWMVLWGAPSWANLLSGSALAVAVLVAVRGRATGGEPAADIGFRPLAAARLAAWFGWKLVESSTIVAWEVLTPTQRTRQGIVRVELATSSPSVVAIVANIITLTPGTLVLEVADRPSRLFVHVLHLRDLDAVQRDVSRLEDLAERAFPARSERTTSAPPNRPEGTHGP